MKLKSVKKVNSKSKRYDIQTSSGNFFANNVLVHNSLLIVSKYKKELIVRTRGTFDASKLQNGHEIQNLKEKYPLVFDNILLNTERYSFLFEWTTPTCPIVLSYDEPTLRLIGIVCHANYSYFGQVELDHWAESIGVGRPKYYQFNSLKEAVDNVSDWEGSEGVVCYSENGQIIKKIKSEWYLTKHYYMTGFRSPKKALEVWELVGGPLTYEDFRAAVELTYDYEIAEFLDEHIHKISNEIREVYLIYEDAERLLANQPDDRKERAKWIETGHSPLFKKLAFLHLSGKALSTRTLKKILKERIK